MGAVCEVSVVPGTIRTLIGSLKTFDHVNNGVCPDQRSLSERQFGMNSRSKNELIDGSITFAPVAARAYLAYD